MSWWIVCHKWINVSIREEKEKVKNKRETGSWDVAAERVDVQFIF
jgi:hypothetical protein